MNIFHFTPAFSKNEKISRRINTKEIYSVEYSFKIHTLKIYGINNVSNSCLKNLDTLAERYFLAIINLNLTYDRYEIKRTYWGQSSLWKETPKTISPHEFYLIFSNSGVSARCRELLSSKSDLELLKLINIQNLFPAAPFGFISTLEKGDFLVGPIKERLLFLYRDFTSFKEVQLATKIASYSLFPNKTFKDFHTEFDYSHMGELFRNWWSLDTRNAESDTQIIDIAKLTNQVKNMTKNLLDNNIKRITQDLPYEDFWELAKSDFTGLSSNNKKELVLFIVENNKKLYELECEKEYIYYIPSTSQSGIDAYSIVESELRATRVFQENKDFIRTMITTMDFDNYFGLEKGLEDNKLFSFILFYIYSNLNVINATKVYTLFQSRGIKDYNWLFEFYKFCKTTGLPPETAVLLMNEKV